MLRFSLVALTAFAVVGCGGADCSQSADIQVTVVPNADVATASIIRLHVMLVVDDGNPRSLDITPQKTLTTAGSAFILRPDPAPSPKYLVTLTVQAFDADSTLIAIGSESQQVLNQGCNRLSLHLAGLPAAPVFDLASSSTDMAGIVPPVPPDLAGCIGGTPDEDSDGRSNICDACPADSDPSPVDSDGDGLPDACDPDPAAATNKLLYFEPFDAVNPNWSGNNANTITQSYLKLDPNQPGIALSNNATDTLPLNVRAQTFVFPEGYYPGTSPIDTGLFVGTNPNPGAPGAMGALCRLNGSNNTLEVFPVANGTLLGGTATALNINGALYRIRLTQRGNKWNCEAVVNNTTVAVNTTQAVTAPLYISLRAENMSVHFHSVVAETALP